MSTRWWMISPTNDEGAYERALAAGLVRETLEAMVEKPPLFASDATLDDVRSLAEYMRRFEGE